MSSQQPSVLFFCKLRKDSARGTWRRAFLSPFPVSSDLIDQFEVTEPEDADIQTRERVSMDHFKAMITVDVETQLVKYHYQPDVITDPSQPFTIVDRDTDFGVTAKWASNLPFVPVICVDDESMPRQRVPLKWLKRELAKLNELCGASVA